jgi:hypothetical protein
VTGCAILPFPADRLEWWRPYPGWEGWYDVSDKGRVRSLDRIVTDRNGRRSRQRGIIRTPGLGGAGYLTIRFYRPGQQITKNLHEVVLETFVGLCPPGQQARHGPRGPLFNWWPEDLCWGTSAENNGVDKERDGSLTRGERHGQAKLTEAKARQILIRYAAGDTSYARLGVAYDVSRWTIRGIVTGRTWRWLTVEAAAS